MPYPYGSPPIDCDPYFDAEEDRRSGYTGVPCARRIQGRTCYPQCCLCEYDVRAKDERGN
jgi:hypothetical protein